MTAMESNNVFRYKVLDALGVMSSSLGPIAAEIMSASGISHYEANGQSGPVENLAITNDASQVLAAIRSHWREVFEPFFGYPVSQRVRSLIFQVIDVRNTYEGHPDGDYSYADEALVDIRRLLEAFSAYEAAQKVSELKQELAQLMLNDSFDDPSNPEQKIPSEAGLVERAIRQYCANGDVLPTTTGQTDFTITEINNSGMKFSKLGQTLIGWAVIDSAVSALRNAGGIAEIGGYNGWAKPGTFERFLQNARGNNKRTSTYVVPALVKAGVVNYVAQSRPKHIRLTKQFVEE